MMDLDQCPDLNYYYYSKKTTPDGVVFYTYIGLRFWYITGQKYNEYLEATHDTVRALIKSHKWGYVKNLKNLMCAALSHNFHISYYDGVYVWKNRLKKDELDWLSLVNEVASK